MRSGFTGLRWAVFCLLLGPLAAAGQDDSVSLGDLARSIRSNKTQQQERPVIDNDNLSQAMEDLKKVQPPDKMVFSIDPSGRSFRVSSPDVTCSLSFNARASSLLVKPVLVEDLPLTELLKIDGPGFIQDENLQLELFNGTDWELREITVGVTLERKPGENAELAARARVIPAAEGLPMVTVERRSDVTLLYHLKAEAKAFSTTTFRENIGITPGPDEDWRWSIVEAKGIRPQEVKIPPEPLPPAPLFALPSPLEPVAPTNAPTPSRPEIQSRPTSDEPDAPSTPPSDAPQ